MSDEKQEEEKKTPVNDKAFREYTKEYNKDTYGEDTTNEEISAADHQAKNDYQDDGEPFGSLSKRDRSEKEDVPSKEE